MRRVVLFVLALLWASAAHGLSLTYTDSASFLAALPGPATTVDFEDVAAGTTLPSGSMLDAITFTYSLPPETLKVTDAYDATSGMNSLGLTGGDEALLDGDVLQLEFAPTLALGLYVITSDPAVADEIQLATAAGTAFGSGTEETVLGDGGIVYFLGLVSDTPFSSATLQFANDGQINFAYNVDDIVTTVPEPGTAALLAAGLIGLFIMGRRRLC